VTDDRSEFTAAREAGLRQRHEQRLARAQAAGEGCGDCSALPGRDHSPSCLTNLDGTKALIETATRLGRALGRKEAGEEMAAAFEAFFPDPHTETEACEDCMVVHEFAAIARNIAAREIATKETRP
jgi:hypothetical protein